MNMRAQGITKHPSLDILQSFAVVFAQYAVGCVFVVSSFHASAQSIRIAYDPVSTVALGSTLDISNYGQALDDCMDYTADDFKYDSTGATKSRIKISFVSTYDELMSDISKDFSLSNKGSIGIPGVKGETDLNLTVKKTDYDKSEDRTLLLGLTARSEYGRRYLQHYALKKEYKDEIAKKDWPDLHTHCGTHFVRAESRVAQLTLVIAITGLDRTSKSTLLATLKNTSKGSFTVGDLTGGAENTITANLSSVVEIGKRVGTVSLDYIAVGGSGISDAGAALKSTDPEDVKALLSGLGEVSKNFTQDNSAPEKLLLIPMTVFGIPATPLDYGRLQKLAKLRQHAADIESEMDMLSDYKSKNDAFYAKYFTDSWTKLEALDALLTSMITTCANGGACEDATKNPDIAFMEDVLTNSKLVLSCTYTHGFQRYDVAGNKIRVGLLDTATVNMTGMMRFTDQVDLPSVKIYRLNLDTGKVDDRTSAALNGISLSDADADQKQKAFASIDYQNFSATTNGAESKPFSQVNDELVAARRQLSGGTYLIEFPTRLWVPKVVVGVGVPDATACPTSKTVPIK
jgi:hypothetical protein